MTLRTTPVLTESLNNSYSLEGIPIAELERACRAEAESRRRGQQTDDRYCVELFRRALRNDIIDAEARDAVARIYTDFVKAQLNRAAIPSSAFDDLVQQSWLRFWEAAHKSLHCNRLGEILSFLQQATIWAILEMRRKYRRAQRELSLEKLQETDDEHTFSDLKDPLDAYIRRRFRERINEVLEESLERRIFYLRYSLMLKPQKIAKLLNNEETPGDEEETSNDLQKKELIEWLKNERVLLKEQPTTALSVSRQLERSMKRLIRDQELRDLLTSE